METSRKSKYPISKIFLNRWSPRSMTGEEITDEELMTLFEAARWAPSSFNEQPWRFIYAKSNSSDFKKFFNLLVEGNQEWCKNASVLVCAVSKKTFTRNDKPHKTHMFSTGSAYENLALQASMMNLVCHGMGGFDSEKARTILKVPEEYEVNMMFALGKPDNKKIKSEKISGRKPLKEIIFEGKFKEN